MTPAEVAASYDLLADHWSDDSLGSSGLAQIKRALQFRSSGGIALDVGCGNGRCFPLLAEHGYVVHGIDASARMISLAEARFPESRIELAEICRWELPKQYDLIVAWDSIWHVPLPAQRPVLEKLCLGLTPGGLIVFSTGGVDSPAEKRDAAMGPPMYYSVLGITDTLKVLSDSNCVCRHLEYDQHPEKHVCIVAQKLWDGGEACSDDCTC